MHGEFDKLFYPYYGMLSSAEQKLYQELLPAIRRADKEISLRTKLTLEEAQHVMYSIYYDRPELFFFMGGSNLLLTNGLVTSIKPNYNECADDLAGATAKFNAAVRNFLTSVRGKELLFQEKLIHDRLVLETSYESNDLDQTAYAVFVNKKAVCSGYTKAFQLLMHELDVPCYYCSGESLRVETGTWEAHSWDIIRLGGDFYNIDITWDDCFDQHAADKVGYTYYNCTDRDIQANHKRADRCIGLPACNGTKLSFEKITGIDAELAVVLQDGVTYKEPVRTKKEFCSAAEKQIMSSRTGNIVFSLPTDSAEVKEKALEWFQEVGVKLYPRRNQHCRIMISDYQNGWYKIQLELTLD